MVKQLNLPTLLVVAENPSVRFWVKKHLDDQFFVLSAENRKEAIGNLDARLDFIIIDTELENPLNLCKELSQIVKKNPIPILLITGRLKKSFREQAIASGVTGFLSDQLDIDELQARIEEGRKVVASRHKTEDLGSAIKIPKISPHGSLKNKLVIDNRAVRILAEAKKGKIPASLLVLQIDGVDQLENQEGAVSALCEFVRGLLREKDVLLPTEEGCTVLLSNIEIDAAKTIAKKLKDKIEQTSAPFSRKYEVRPPQSPGIEIVGEGGCIGSRLGSFHLTVSIAVSPLEGSEKEFVKMIDSATKSLKTRSAANFIISLDGNG